MFNSEHVHSCFRTVNNATLLAGFASFCIMAIELDARAALQPVLLEAEAFYYSMEEAGADYDGIMPDMADQGDEDRFADYNYEPDFDDDDYEQDDDREQEKLEGIWHRRELENAY